MMDAPKRGVVNHSLGARRQWCQPREALHRFGSFSSGLVDPFDVEDHSPSLMLRSGSNDHELRAVSHLTRSFEMKAGVGFMANLLDLTSRLVDSDVTTLGLEQGGYDLAVGVEH